MPLVRPRLSVTLPVSQEVVEIRKLKARDFMAGGLPDPIRELKKMTAAEHREMTDAEKERLLSKPEVMEYNVSLVLAAITKHPEGARLVLKMPNDCTDGEFSWWDLEDADQAALQSAVFGLVREGAAQAAAFS